MNNLLPPNATELERALAEATARLGSLPVPVRTVWNPQTCPAPLLPWLAWAFSVDDWVGLSEAQRRALIAASYRIHRRKGTVSAVREILNASNADVRLVEWWQTQPQGTPHTFTVEVEIEDRGITQGTLENIERQIVSVKPVRSHFTTRLIGKTRAAIHIGLAAFSGEHTEILPYRLTEAEAPPTIPRLAVGWWEHITTTIYPQGAHG